MNLCRTLGTLMLAAVGTSLPAAGQETGAAPLPDSALTLVFVVFPTEAGAQQAYTNLSTNDQATAGHIQDYAVLSRDQDGNVAVQQSPEASGTGTAAATADRAISGVESSLGAQPGGTGAGASQSGISDQNLSRMRNLLRPGTSALVAVTMEPYLPSVVRSVQRGQEMPVVQAAIMPSQE